MDGTHNRPDILFDSRWLGPHGIGRFASEILKRLNMTTFDSGPAPSSPIDPIYLTGYLAAYRPKLFFSPGYNGPLPFWFSYVFSLHDINFIDVPENTNTLKSTFFNQVTLRVARGSARIITVSEFSRTRIIEWSGLSQDRVVNVGNGVSEEFQPIGERYKPGFPYILYVGNTKAHKNLKRLIEAFSRSKISEEINLLVSGALDVELNAMILRLGLAGRVAGTGFIPDNDLPAYYRGALGLAFPSIYEGFGLPLLEAMACGTPTLTSTVSALPEVAGDAAILVNPYDVNAISHGIEQLATDEILRQNLREKGFNRAALFSWDETARRTLAVLDQVLEEGR